MFDLLMRHLVFWAKFWGVFAVLFFLALLYEGVGLLGTLLIVGAWGVWYYDIFRD